jgi:hypothetical protein
VRCFAANWKHGERSQKAIEDARYFRWLIKLGKSVGLF